MGIYGDIEGYVVLYRAIGAYIRIRDWKEGLP